MDVKDIDFVFSFTDDNKLFVVQSGVPGEDIVHEVENFPANRSFCRNKGPFVEICRSGIDVTGTIIYKHECIYSFDMEIEEDVVERLYQEFPEMFYMDSVKLEAFIIAKKYEMFESFLKGKINMVIFDYTNSFETFQHGIFPFYMSQKMFFFDFLYDYCKSEEISFVTISDYLGSYVMGYHKKGKYSGDVLFDTQEDLAVNVADLGFLNIR